MFWESVGIQISREATIVSLNKGAANCKTVKFNVSWEEISPETNLNLKEK